MEIGQPVSQPHSTTESWDEQKKWPADRDPFYSVEQWKESKEWDEVSETTTMSLPVFGNSGNVDKLLYQNLVEMIPLVESFMEQRCGQSKSFPRRSSLIYTPTPSRLGTEGPAKGKSNRQPFRSEFGDIKDSVFWDDNENQCPGSREAHSKEIQTVECPNGGVAGNLVSNSEILQLQSQIEELEEKLQEKEKLLLAAEDNAKQIHHELQQKVEEFEKDLLHKKQQIQDVHMELSGKQQEIATILSLLERAEANALESKRKALGIEEELNGLRCKVSVLLFQLENTQVEAGSDYGLACDSPEQTDVHSRALKGQMKADEQADWKLDEMELEHMESVRWKYVEAIVAARENPGEELLSQAAELRAQLHAFLLRPTFANLANDLLFSQVPRYSMY